MRISTLLSILLIASLQSFSQVGNNDPTFNTIDTGNGGVYGFNNNVYVVATQSDGKIVVGGNFTSFNGTARTRIARLNADGTLDPSFVPTTGADDKVWAIAIQSDGKIIIGGQFTSYNGTGRKYIARLKSDGAIDPSFDPGTGFDAPILLNSIVVQSSGKIIVGGSFLTYNGTTRLRLTRLTSVGGIDVSFDVGSGFNNDIYTVAIQNDGKVLVGGSFTTYRGTTRNRIARLDSLGAIDATFDPGTGFNTGAVYKIAVQSDGKIIAVGSFFSYQGNASSRIVRINSDASYDGTFAIGTGLNNITYETFVFNNKVIAAGGFTSFNGTTKGNIARLKSTGGIDASFGTGTGSASVIYSSAIQTSSTGKKIIIGGGFTSFDGVGRNRIARLTLCSVTSSTISPSVCYTYTSPLGHVWTTSGTRYDTLTNSTGCDSIIRINLTIHNNTTATISPSVCYTYTSPSGNVWTTTGTRMDTIPNVAGCDSIITINLTIKHNSTSTISPSVCRTYTSPSGNVWTTTGTRMDTIPNAAGCDSIMTINLTIKNTTSSFSAAACFSYTSPSGKNWTTSGVRMDTIPNMAGCDSIMTINLSINNSSSSFSANACASYTSPSGKIWTTSGVRMDTIPNSKGCDSIMTINLSINNSSSSFSASACASYTSPSGKIWTTNGVRMDTIPNYRGCDSVMTITLFINNSSSSFSASACDSYTSPSGKIWTVSNTYTDTIPNLLGCDSIMTINLSINNSSSSFAASACISYTSPSGKVWTVPNTYMDTIPNSFGCDSIMTINLSINQSSSSFAAYACATYISPSGQTWTVPNTYMDTIPNSFGCDSIMTINLTIGYTVSTFSATACVSYTSPSGKLWTISNTYTDTIPSVVGCDSIMTINLTINQLPIVTTTLTGYVITADETGAAYQWVSCPSYTLIAGAAAQSYTATANGSYAVIVTKNGCVDTSSCVPISGIGITQITKNASSTLVYPNPSHGIFTFTSFNRIDEVIVTDVLGNVVMQKSGDSTSLLLDLTGHAQGIYFAKVRSNGQQQIIRLVVD